jgi:hypothetical protein
VVLISPGGPLLPPGSRTCQMAPASSGSFHMGPCKHTTCKLPLPVLAYHEEEQSCFIVLIQPDTTESRYYALAGPAPLREQLYHCAAVGAGIQGFQPRSIRSTCQSTSSFRQSCQSLELQS